MNRVLDRGHINVSLLQSLVRVKLVTIKKIFNIIVKQMNNFLLFNDNSITLNGKPRAKEECR